MNSFVVWNNFLVNSFGFWRYIIINLQIIIILSLLFLNWFLIERKLIYNVVSAVQQRKSAIIIHINSLLSLPPLSFPSFFLSLF